MSPSGPFARRLLLPLWVVVLSVPVVAAFALTALLCAAVTAALRTREVPLAQTLLLGVLCGLVAWLFVAVFHIRRERLVLPAPDGDAFRDRLRAELEALGYREGASSPEALLFRPPFTSFLVGGAIRVQWGPGTASVVGPRVFLEVLRHRLRVERHVGGVRRSVADSWVRRGKHLLRRVEVRMRVPAEQWPDVYADVIEVLAGDGARVVCDVSILAHSEQGIVRQTVDVVIRDRLRQKHLEADIRQEPLRRSGEAAPVSS
jgi:hypothetical protein